MNALIITFLGENIEREEPLTLSRGAWEAIQAGADIYALDELPVLGSNQTIQLIGDEFN